MIKIFNYFCAQSVNVLCSRAPTASCERARLQDQDIMLTMMYSCLGTNIYIFFFFLTPNEYHGNCRWPVARWLLDEEASPTIAGRFMGVQFLSIIMECFFFSVTFSKDKYIQNLYDILECFRSCLRSFQITIQWYWTVKAICGLDWMGWDWISTRGHFKSTWRC